jgi:hypothetical protein
MNYKTLDTLVVTTTDRTKSVRVSATITDEGKSATLWTFSRCRFTHFGDGHESCRKINGVIGDILNDSSIVEELNSFTDRFN